MVEVAVAVFSLIIGAAISAVQMQQQNLRSSHETYIRHIFQAVKDRFGIAYDQLNQAAEKLGINLNQLTEATRGSARLSVASDKLRRFVQQYPDRVKDINNKKNALQNVMNNISAKEEAAAASIQSGGAKAYDSTQALNDAVGLIMQGNQVLNGESDSQIDTTLIDRQKQEAEERKQRMDERVREHIQETFN